MGTTIWHLAPGDRVVLVSDVERYPHAYVRAGETGTVAYADADGLGVTLDATHPGLAEWDNQLCWYHEPPRFQGFGRPLTDPGPDDSGWGPAAARLQIARVAP